LRFRLTSEPGHEKFPLKNHFLGKVRVDLHEEFVLGKDFFAPLARIDVLKFGESFLRETLQTGGVKVFGARDPTQRRLMSARAAVDAVDHPGQYTHVFPKTRPQIL